MLRRYSHACCVQRHSIAIIGCHHHNTTLPPTPPPLSHTTHRAFHNSGGGRNDLPAWQSYDEFLSPISSVESSLISDQSFNLRGNQNDKSGSSSGSSSGFDFSGASGGGGGAYGMADTATGLRNTSIGQLSAEDVLLKTETALKWYSPCAYGWLMLPSIDLIDVMALSGVIPKDHPQIQIARWMASPEDIVHMPSALIDLLGPERYNIVNKEVCKLVRDYEHISPLLKTLDRYPTLPRELWLAILRWMAVLCSVPEMKGSILSLTLAISNGIGPRSLGLPDSQQARGAMVGQLLIGAGAEYGAVGLAQLGVDLLFINGASCTFQDQKMLTLAFHRTSGRVMDWSVRQSGELQRCLPKWLANHAAGNMSYHLARELEKQSDARAVVDSAARPAEDSTTTTTNDDRSSAAATTKKRKQARAAVAKAAMLAAKKSGQTVDDDDDLDERFVDDVIGSAEDKTSDEIFAQREGDDAETDVVVATKKKSPSTAAALLEEDGRDEELGDDDMMGSGSSSSSASSSLMSPPTTATSGSGGGDAQQRQQHPQHATWTYFTAPDEARRESTILRKALVDQAIERADSVEKRKHVAEKLRKKFNKVGAPTVSGYNARSRLKNKDKLPVRVQREKAIRHAATPNSKAQRGRPKKTATP